MADAIKNRKSRKNPIRARDEITRDAGHILHPRTQSTGIQTESPAKAKFQNHSPAGDNTPFPCSASADLGRHMIPSAHPQTTHFIWGFGLPNHREISEHVVRHPSGRPHNSERTAESSLVNSDPPYINSAIASSLSDRPLASSNLRKNRQGKSFRYRTPRICSINSIKEKFPSSVLHRCDSRRGVERLARCCSLCA